jgi:hypothetical protein
MLLLFGLFGVGGATMLQAGRSRIRFSMRQFDSFKWSIPSRQTMAQPLTEMRTRNIPVG